MARRRSRTLTELELEIMQIIWSKTEAAVGDVQEALEAKGSPLALSSIRTMLSILRKKGYLRRRRRGRGHVYQPVMSEEEARKSFVEDLVQRVFRGSPLSLVASLVNTDVISKRELAKVKDLIHECERGKKP